MAKKKKPNPVAKKLRSPEYRLKVIKNKMKYSRKDKYRKVEEGLDVKVKGVHALANKHGVSVDMINRQLDIGIKVEREHTTDEATARKIALAHLDELPDYYTRLKKMEEGKTYGKFLNYLHGKVKKADEWSNSGHTVRGVLAKKLKNKVDKVHDWANSDSSPAPEPKPAQKPKKRTTRKAKTRPKKSKLTTAITKAFRKGYNSTSTKSRKRIIRPRRGSKVKASFKHRYLRHLSPI